VQTDFIINSKKHTVLMVYIVLLLTTTVPSITWLQDHNKRFLTEKIIDYKLSLKQDVISTVAFTDTVDHLPLLYSQLTFSSLLVYSSVWVYLYYWHSWLPLLCEIYTLLPLFSLFIYVYRLYHCISLIAVIATFISDHYMTMMVRWV